MINNVVLTGRLTADPELKTTSNGICVTSFSIAVERRNKSADGERETDFINITAWRKTAEFVTKYFSKGDMIGIMGSIQTRKYTDKDGNKRTAFEVLAENVDFVGGKKSNETATESQQAPAPSFPTYSGQDMSFTEINGSDDLPF